MQADSTMTSSGSRDILMTESAKKLAPASAPTFGKWKTITKHLTVEPAMVLYYTNYVIVDFINTNLYLQKNCRNDTSFEPDLRTKCDDNKRGVTFVNNTNYHFRYALVSLMVIHTILSSCWSDRVGRKRKPFIIFPIIGQILQLSIACFQSYFWYWPAEYAVASDLFCQILSGGFVLCLNMCITYSLDVSGIEERTTKLTMIYALQILCGPIGSGISGYLLTGVGFFYSYVICLTLASMSLISAVFLIRDVSVPVEKKPSYLSFFNLKDVLESVKMVFRRSLGDKRCIVMVLLIIHVTVWINFEGQKSVFYLYFVYAFKWDEKKYSVYVMCKLIGLTFGTFFSSLVLSKYLKIHDGVIGCFASFWDTMADIGFTFARQNWQLYLIPVMDIFHGTAIAVHHSFISKYFESHEYGLGEFFSLYSTLENFLLDTTFGKNRALSEKFQGRLTSTLNVFSLFVAVSHPIFSFLFSKTMDTFPSAFFIVGGIFDFITCLLYGLSYYLCKRISS